MIEAKGSETDFVLDRAREVWQASPQTVAVSNENAADSAALHHALQAAAHHAPLYFRFIIPPWPPRLLLRKILRRISAPFWMGQVQFNEAARDSLHGLFRRADGQSQRLDEQQMRIDELEREIADLHTLVRQITAAPLPVAASILPAIPPVAEGPWPASVARVAQELARPTGGPTPLYFDGLDDPAAHAAAPGSKPRAAFISPFPPVQSGVADYSEEIIGPLSDYYELDLWTDSGYKPRLPARFTTLPLAVWERKLKISRPYQTAIYQMGNNGAFHAQSYFLLLRYAGITVIHDYLLTHLIAYICVEMPHLGLRLHDELIYEIGKAKADAIMNDINRGKMPMGDFTGSGIPMNRRIFTRSLGVVLHNQWSFEQAQKDRADDNELITLIPPVMPPVTLGQTKADIDALRNKWGVPRDAFVFAPCGIVTETKRPLAILDAFKILLAERPDAFLLFVGSVAMPPGVDFDNEIKKRGLTERVKITGYVNVPTFNEYLLLSDVCVTLRFPSQGETSGALLRMLVHGKPSIVTAIGSFDDFPDDTVHKLPTPDKMKDEVGEIAQAFRLLANDKAYREKIAANGLAYLLREHSPERCARLYAQFVDEVMAHPTTRRKLLADWAGRDIALRTQAGANGDALLGELRDALHASAPVAAAAPVGL